MVYPSRHGTSSRTSRLRSVLTRLSRDRLLYLLAVPGFLYFLLFHYLPMYGITIAFTDYSVYRGFGAMKFVGFANFRTLFGLYGFQRAFRNTIILSLLKLVFGFPSPIILALLVNEVGNRVLKKTIQTAVILPFFISWVVISGIFYALFSPNIGAIKAVALFFGYRGKVVNVLASMQYFRTLLVASHVWQAAGFQSVIYLAAIATVDLQLYEAANMDGAGRLRQIWHVTLPGIRRTIIILLIFRMGALLNVGFDQVFNLYNPLVYEVSEILDTFIYKIGINEAKFALATASGLFKSLIGLALVLSTNALARRIDQEGALV